MIKAPQARSVCLPAVLNARQARLIAAWALVLLAVSLFGVERAEAATTTVSVKEFGAVGDGVTDDTAAIRNALRATASPRKLVFPTGTYVFSNVMLPSGTAIEFQTGASAVLKIGSTSADNFFFAEGTAMAPVTDISLRGGSFAGRPSGRSALVVINGSRISVADIRTNGLSKGVGFQSSSYVTVRNSVVENSHIGFVFDDVHHAEISGCTSRKSARDGIIFYNRSRYAVATNNLVEDYMTVNSTGVGGIHVYGSTDATITGNVVRRGYNDSAGIRFHDAERFWCADNLVESPGSSGYQVHRVGDYAGLTGGNGTFINNVVVGARLRGFDVPDPLIKRVAIIGNTIRNTVSVSSVSAGTGIMVKPAGSTIIGNVIETGTGPGIEVGGSGQIIAWNEIRDVASVNFGPRVGVFLSGTSHGVVANSVTDTLKHMLNGVRLYTGGSALVKGNYVAGSTGSAYDLRGTSLSALRADKTPPSISASRAMGPSGATVITVTASDSQSRVEAIQVEIAGERTYFSGGKGSVQVTDQDHVVDIRAIDAAGNIGQKLEYHGLKPTQMKVTAVSPTTTVAYRTLARMSGTLTDANGVPLANTSVSMQRWNPATWRWDVVTTSTTDALGAWQLQYAMPISGLYRAAATDWTAGYQPSATSSYRMLVRAYLTAPGGPSLGTGGKWYAYSGILRPRHTAGSKPVKVMFYRYQSGRWVLRKTLYAKASTIDGGSRYTAWAALPTGRWYVRAYHADAEHAPTYSIRRYFRLR